MPLVRWLIVAGIAVASGFSGYASATRSPRQQSATPSATILYEGATIERTATKGETHRYEVSLNEGDFLELSVTQDLVLVTLSARGPDGTLVHSINLPDVDPFPEHLMFVASGSGRFSIEVETELAESAHVEHEPRRSSRLPSSTRGYILRVAAIRRATDADRARSRSFETLARAAEREHLRTIDGIREAAPLYAEAAGGWRSTGDAVLEAATLEALAHMTGYFTQFNRESIAARERLAELFAQMPQHAYLEVHNLRSLGTEYLEAGRLADAKQTVARALELSLVHGFSQTAAASERNLGLYEFELGNYEWARELGLRAQERAAAIPDGPLEALTLYDLSRLDAAAGDFDAAIARSKRGLELAGDNPTSRNVLIMWLGFYHLRRGELDEAESLFNARLEMARKTVNRDQEALTRLGIADVMLARGDRDGARKGYEAAALALERGAQHWRCISEERLGRLDLEDGQLDRAFARFETMAQIALQRQSPTCEAEARAGLADVAARRGDLEAADAEARRVVELTEAFRQAAVSVESRTLGFGSLAPAYERAIDISMRRADRGDHGALERALMLNEQALARGLLDRVTETRLDSHARVPAALEQDHHRVRERWRARLAELQVAMRIDADAPRTLRLAEETRALAVQVRDLESKIDAADPRHATFVRPHPLALEGIQSLLGDDTLLLEYALGDARSYLWVVSACEIKAFTLPARAEIEGLAWRLHDQLARSGTPGAEPKSGRGSAEENRAVLSRVIIGPASALLGEKRLVLVLPGALSLVPFGALPDSAGDAMIARHEIVQIPSATTLGAMRTAMDGRSPPTKVGAVFADPIFDADDPRVRREPSLARSVPIPSEPRAGGLALTRLPFSRGEAQEIASLARGSVSVFLGFEASRERVLGRALANFGFIHFATHGVVNQKVPGLSSVVLSLVDRAGHPRDGFVMVPDIYDMTLNADVVVLSGCQTALGKQVQGEGPIGLARGFMYAGVPRVVASLWQVDDLATAELMRRFYRGMLVNGLRPSAALRAAQRELAATHRWRSPYFWAPFVLQGEWR
jgi:CHAT domain-containing protein